MDLKKKMMIVGSDVVKVKTEKLLSCMKCPLCKKKLRDATTISECLHTFCRKCIHEKLVDEEQECCPICKINLGCAPAEKLRPDHNLEELRANIFPSKRTVVRASESTPESLPPIPMPTRRKERSLSSLGVSTPRVSTETSLTGRRTKAAARKAAALHGSSISVEESVTEENVDGCPQKSTSRENLNKIVQYKRQHSSTANPHNHLNSNKETVKAIEPCQGKVDLWKPLNCLVEAANRTKPSKISLVKSEPFHAPNTEGPVRKAKIQEQVYVRNHPGKNSPSALELAKPKKYKRKRDASEELGTSGQAILDTAGFKQSRNTPIWFTLLASDDQAEEAPLPQISTCYLRIKDGNVPVSFIQKYLVKKLDLSSEAEVEITCRGQPVVPTLQLQELVDVWLQKTSMPQRVSVGSSAKDFMMVLTYRRKVRPT